MNAQEFLAHLWTPTPPGFILVWELVTKQSKYLKAPAGAVAIPAGAPDVYTGVGLAHKSHGKNKRTPNHLVRAIPGLWADIDVNGGPDEKQGAADNKTNAIEAAAAFAEPSVVVDSGYGIQAWWLFEEPWVFTNRDEQHEAARAAAQCQKLIRDSASFGVDYTHDLARILRLPGTSNAKGKERMPVKVTEVGQRYPRRALLALCAKAGDVDPGYRFHEVVGQVKVDCRPDTSCPKLDHLIAHSPRFRRAWSHQRKDLPSTSEYDLSVASMAVFAGWSDQEVADLICTHRRRVNPEDSKATRVDYVRRTVARARQQRGEEEAEPKLKAVEDERDEWAESVVKGLEDEGSGAIPLPFDTLTEAMDGGLRPGDVCLVAGWTSNGKSVFLDQMADIAAGEGRRVHLYLTEMTPYERGLRLLARKTDVPYRELRRRENLDDKDRWKTIMAELSHMPYGCTNVANWTVEDVCGDIAQKRWDLAIVDLIHGFHYQDERDLSKTSSALTRAAKASVSKDFAGTAIVCAAHLNDGQMRDQRSVQRPRPGLHSIKGSSSLKQDADTVIFVYREDDPNGFCKDDGEIWLAKSRNGGAGAVKVYLDVENMMFKEKSVWLKSVPDAS